MELSNSSIPYFYVTLVKCLKVLQALDREEAGILSVEGGTNTQKRTDDESSWKKKKMTSNPLDGTIKVRSAALRTMEALMLRSW